MSQNCALLNFTSLNGQLDVCVLWVVIDAPISYSLFTNFILHDIDPHLNRDRKFQFGDVNLIMKELKKNYLTQYFDLILKLI